MDQPTTVENNNTWIKCQSKSRPGQFYMFNTKSGENFWCTTSESLHQTQQNILGQNKMKTPAQDRLKRLQKNLEKTKHKDSSVTKAKDGSRNKKLEFSSDKKIVETIKETPASSSSNEIPSTKSTKNSMESIVSDRTTAEKNTPLKSNEKDALVATEKQQSNSDSDKSKFLSPKKPSKDRKSRSSKKKAPKRKHNDVVNSTCNSLVPTEQFPTNPPSNLSPCLRKDNTDASSPKKIRDSKGFEGATSPATEKKFKSDLNDNEEPSKEQKSSIVSMLKEYCSSLFKKAISVEKTEEVKKQSNLSQKSKTSFKSKQSVLKSSSSQVSDSERLLLIPNLSANTNLTSSSFSKGIANDRLERLRRSLQHQQTVLNRPQQILSPSIYTLTSSPSNDSISSSTTSHFEIESMDWQPICEDSTPLNNTTSSSAFNLSVSNVSTQSEHYDTINENLLRLAANKKQQEHHWKIDYFYFVVDTNVFLENVTFVDELTTMKLCDTTGTLIYIPYCVLQELDKLKIRSPSESIKTRAIRAIHFINKAFEERKQHIQAQSSADENEHLIKVTSPDDSILNCCLQVKEHIENLMLLTEDINLRNKAMCSDILVSTKSDLITKHESRL